MDQDQSIMFCTFNFELSDKAFQQELFKQVDEDKFELTWTDISCDKQQQVPTRICVLEADTKEDALNVMKIVLHFTEVFVIVQVY